MTRKFLHAPVAGSLILLASAALAAPASAQSEEVQATGEALDQLDVEQLLFEQSVEARRNLERRGQVAQRARGDFASAVAAGRHRARANPATFAGPAYRRHAVRLGTDPHWQAMEDRAIRAQRGRPGFAIGSVDDLTAGERHQLDRAGRNAQRARGARLPNRPVAQVARAAPTYRAAGTVRGSVAATSSGRSGGGVMGLARQASNLDLGAEAFGGRDLGVTRFGADMTVGQIGNALRGGDPVAAAVGSTRQLGRDLGNGLVGIGESIADPRRIPGNTVRAVQGVGQTAVATVGFVGETALRGVHDGARMLVDPQFAAKQVGKAGQTVGNVAKSVCNGLSYLNPFATKKGC